MIATLPDKSGIFEGVKETGDVYFVVHPPIISDKKIGNATENNAMIDDAISRNFGILKDDLIL
jgi:hypothetical protein